MKTYIQALALSLLVVGTVSCREEQLPTFGDAHFLQFKQASEEIYRFSFATHPGETTYDLEIPVLLIGKALTQAEPYEVEVVSDGETATTVPSANYSLPSSLSFGEGVFEDVLRVTLKDSEALATEKFLVLRIKGNDVFSPGPEGFRTAVISLTNKLARPAWWNDDMERLFLGPYSDIKYETFILATGISDLTDATAAQIAAYVVQFVYYLREKDAAGQPVYEADGMTMVLSSVPYAKNA